MPKIPPEVLERREKEDARVVSVLRDAGIEVSSVYDLVNDPASYEEAVKPLLEILPELDDPVVKEGVVRALTDPAAHGVAAKPLVQELRNARDNGRPLLAWAIGNALKVVADETVLDDLLELAQDERLGGGRETVIEALARFRGDDAVIETLIRSLEDDSVAGHSIIALRKIGAAKARPQIESFLNHDKAWVRREAKKALAQLAEDGTN